MAINKTAFAGIILSFFLGLIYGRHVRHYFIATNQFYHGKTEQTTSMLLAANGLAALSCQSQSDEVWMSLPFNLHFDYL
ncbi:hypothetical protein WKH37_20095 [Bacillus subtilis]|uniref:hypothetical protein n=1 Tax=Bacillus subtilis TaxID=1423 RepID=UPI000B44B90A|nr:hypothetical protein [Bacillus subtilis]MCP6733145.1 hypothetical protein [Bacillus subtilis]MEC0313534.1 hypothetical protein [Bacillus subtilis]MEC0360617.1 hypothetical protein [Bacillus subtilis]MEC1364770.1 hypothetical protein [Bacillus subtilis]MEC1378290.1 hypothetical protein [Bacillus subtilis]